MQSFGPAIEQAGLKRINRPFLRCNDRELAREAHGAELAKRAESLVAPSGR